MRGYYLCENWGKSLKKNDLGCEYVIEQRIQDYRWIDLLNFCRFVRILSFVRKYECESSFEMFARSD